MMRIIFSSGIRTYIVQRDTFFQRVMIIIKEEEEVNIKLLHHQASKSKSQLFSKHLTLTYVYITRFPD